MLVKRTGTVFESVLDVPEALVALTQFERVKRIVVHYIEIERN